MEKNGEVRIDGQLIAGIEGRSKYLGEYVASHIKGKQAAAFWADRLLRLPTAAARELISGVDLLYLYSNGIDAAADNAKTEASLPDAVASELDTLVGIVKKFATQLNRTHILITADHGFLYQNEKPAEAHMLAAENPAYGYKDRRYLMSDDTPGAHFFTPSSSVTNMDSSSSLHFAEGLYRIRKQGGGTRFVHGGLSLQEVTVPLIRVRVGRKDDVETVGVAIMVPANTVITTPVYTVNFFQEEPVSEKRHPLQVSVFFAAEDGTLLSDRIEMSFDSADPNAQNRGSSAEFHFGPQVNSYNGKLIRLVLEKRIGGTSVPYTKVDFTYQTFGERDF
ncbi:MAG: PglZ domain-containing protein [Spirochaetia bacterium]|nr:PglZ domain-containing protein [Spirochaetia bacterium]